MPEQTDNPVVTDEFTEAHGISAEEAEQARLAHEKKAAESPEELAYEAGRVAADDPTARRAGAEACPFSPVDHPDERKAWFKGLAEALEEQPSLDELRAAVAEETSPNA